jgi:outer membrane protein assembly factor BamB
MGHIRSSIIRIAAGLFILSVSVPAAWASEPAEPTNLPALAEEGSWPMVGANPQRTSWTPVEIRGNLSVEWYRPISARMTHEYEPIAAEDKIFVATHKGLFAFRASDGAHLWTYGTELPLGHSPTYANGVVYVGGYDRRIHAVDAATGALKSGWSFVEAGAGYETNPLVVNNRVYAGNRDGYFYCLDANSGALMWKWRDETDEYPNAPIRFSAAYKDGVIYFGSDNSHAYAIRDNGTSAGLVWKSAMLPGVGFNTYWPVVYTNKSTGKDYVLFSGSKKDASFGWWFGSYDGNGDYYYYQENYELFDGVPYGGLIGALGNVPGDWAAGTVTIDASKIVNYFNNKPQKRHLFILDAGNGSEFTPYAPVTWVSTTHGGDKRPPIIGGDGVMYTHMGYKNGDPGISPNMGASGGVSGWKFGTQYISRLYDFERGYADEEVKFTAGGNLIYWVEGFNMPYGAFEINKPFGTNASWTYAPCGGCLGYTGGGGDSAFVPYKGKLYMLDGNVLVALSATGGLKGLTAVGPASPAVGSSSTIPPDTLRQSLEFEIQRMLAAGPLRPGFHDSGIWGSYANGYYSPGVEPYITGNHLAEYFHNPSDTISTLYWAMPYVSSTLQEQIKTYLHDYYGPGKQNDITAIAHIGWKNGAQREIFVDTPELKAVMQRATDDANSSVASIPRTTTHYNQYQVRVWNFPQDSFYGAWKYAQLFPGEATAVFNAMKGKLEAPLLSDADLLKYPYILNQYIAGYMGYVELGKMAGANVTTQEASLTRFLNLRIDNFSQDASALTSYERNLSTARNFMYMTPELAAELRTRAQAKVQSALTEYEGTRPYWFVSKYDQTSGEGVFHPLYDHVALFEAKAWILQEPYEQLVKYLDVPAFYRGDLYFLQKLVAALQVAPGGPSLTFADVPFSHPYHDEIEALYQAGYTAGCATNPLRYCPEQAMNRAESAVFVERGIHNATYDPPAPTSQVFADLTLDSWAAKWVNGLWQDQYTAGCGTNPLVYCPWQGHTRAEGTVFYLRMMHGAAYDPPQPTVQTFGDVPLDAWYAKWVEAAYAAGLIPACQTSDYMRFCPNDPLTRAVAAYMMVQAKGLR